MVPEEWLLLLLPGPGPGSSAISASCHLVSTSASCTTFSLSSWADRLPTLICRSTGYVVLVVKMEILCLALLGVLHAACSVWGVCRSAALAWYIRVVMVQCPPTLFVCCCRMED